MSTNKAKVLIIPCSGIGKVYGLMGREAVYEAINKLPEDTTDTICLALLVTGDEDAKKLVGSNPCITVDGCTKSCAFKNTKLSDGNVIKSVQVVDIVKNHRGMQPGTATALTDDGWILVDELAEYLKKQCIDIKNDTEE